MAGLYVHVPFRRSSRWYDQSYTVVTEDDAFADYEDALCRELQSYAREYAEDEPITTVYAGGGRPSLLPLQTVHSILGTVVEVFDASAFEEATAELNPADADVGYVRSLRHLGFERLSIQVQSFFPDALNAIDAPHSAEDAFRAIRMVREAGFDDFSVDLLFGWPGQSLSQWRATLYQVVEMNLPHISIVESPDATRSEQKRESVVADQLEFAMTFLQAEGYKQYELTHFARPGHKSVHQVHYYDHGNQLGVGPSAESFWWTDRDQNPVGRRWENVSDLDRYISLLSQRHPPVAYRQTLDQHSLAREYILLRLRTDTGLDLRTLRERYDLDLRAEYDDRIDRLCERGLMQEESETLRLTTKGRLVADAIAQRLWPFD